MIKIYLHTKGANKSEWDNTEYAFAQIPASGEYFVLSPNSPYYQVKLVVHTPYETGAFDAEVWGIEVNQTEVMILTLGEVVE